jgi:hypothetical protein
VDLDALEAAGRGGTLEDVAAQGEAAQLVDPPSRERGHARGVIGAARHADQARGRRVAHQPDRLARDAHADLQLGADRDPGEVIGQHPGDVGVLLVAAVVAHRLAQQAGGDADPDGQIGRAPRRRGHQRAR